MFPDQPNQNSQAPQPVPQQPTYGANAGTPQQTYQTLPPPSVTGHPTGHNPYEFIVNPNTPTKAQGFGGGKNFMLRIAFVVGGLAVLLIVVAVVISALTPKGSATGLKSIATRQQEIIRIASSAATKINGQDTENFVVNVKFTLTSEQHDVLANLSKQHVKLQGKQLSVNKDSKTDTLLSNAATAGTYDNTVTQTLTDQLKIYKSLLQSTYKDTNSKLTKQMLLDDYKAADALLQQAKTLNITN